MIHKIKLLYDNGNGYSSRAIANELQVSRNTIRKYLQMNEEEICRYFKNRERTKKLDQYKEYIICLLKKYEKLFAVKIKRKLKSKGIFLTVSNRNCKVLRLTFLTLFCAPGSFFRTAFFNPRMFLIGVWLYKPRKIDSQCHQKGSLI